MSLEWIDVADTAVKIGLGGLVSGIFTLIAPAVLFQKEALADRRIRRLKLLEESMELYIEATNVAAVSTFPSLRKIKVEFFEGLIVKAVCDSKIHDVLDKGTDAYYDKINRISAKLIIAGSSDISSVVMDYSKTMVSDLRTISVSQDLKSMDEFYNSSKYKRMALRRSIIEKMSSDFKLEPEILISMKNIGRFSVDD